MFATGLVVALIDTLIPVFIGKLVRLMEAQDRAAALAQRIGQAGQGGRLSAEARVHLLDSAESLRSGSRQMPRTYRALRSSRSTK